MTRSLETQVPQWAVGTPFATALFASATVVNIVVALGLAAVLFGSFTIG